MVTSVRPGVPPMSSEARSPNVRTSRSRTNANPCPSGTALAKNPMVGGAPMYASKSIVENAVNSKDHTTLVTAVKAAGLVDTLAGRGPFTVFAPTNAAFAKLPAGTVNRWSSPRTSRP